MTRNTTSKFFLPWRSRLLKQLRHQHGIFSSGNTDGDLVTVLDQLVFVDRLCELPPDLFAELFDNAALDLAAAVRILPPASGAFVCSMDSSASCAGTHGIRPCTLYTS